MRPALFESQDSAGRFVLNAEESKVMEENG